MDGWRRTDRQTDRKEGCMDKVVKTSKQKENKKTKESVAWDWKISRPTVFYWV